MDARTEETLAQEAARQFAQTIHNYVLDRSPAVRLAEEREQQRDTRIADSTQDITTEPPVIPTPSTPEAKAPDPGKDVKGTQQAALLGTAPATTST